MNLVVTGSRGFLGTNFRNRVTGTGHSVIEVTRDDDWPRITDKVQGADVVFHFAGVNRVPDDAEYETGNTQLTQRLCAAMAGSRHPPAVVFASSAQVTRGDNAYARSKLAAENVVADYASSTGAKAWISRLPNVFGPWARPNYNSVIATYSFNISRGRQIEIHEPDRELKLVYVDDAVNCLLENAIGDAATVARARGGAVAWVSVRPTYRIRLARLAELIGSLGAGRRELGDADPELLAKLGTTYDWYATNGGVFDD